jgi:hypothetical protein
MVDMLIPLFGLSVYSLSVRRISLKNFSRAHQRAFFVTIAVIPIFLIVIGTSSIILWTLIGCLSLILRALPNILSKFRRTLSLEESIQLLDRLILSMRSGFSLRSSLKEASRDGAKETRRAAQDLFERLENGGVIGPRDVLTGEILRELRRIEARATRSIEAVQSLRSALRIRADFRRKSGQITLQIRLQAALAVTLYLPLLFIQWRSGHLFAARTLLSMFLFAGAQIWIQMVFRRFEWKV